MSSVDDYDWGRFEITFFYYAPRERVFSCFATSAGLTSFYVRESVATAGDTHRAPDEVFEAGDEYRWTYTHPFEITGRVTAVERNERVAFTFGPMNVEVLLEDAGDATKLLLRQTGIGDDDRVLGHLNCRSCWVYFLTNLKSVLEHGVDLRDREHPGRASSMEVGYPLV